MLDIGIVIPELVKYGGAERLLIECLVRWQDQHRLTVYSTAFDKVLLAEAGLHHITLRKLRLPFEGENAIVLNAALLPKIWECEIGRHDVYHAHLWPLHLLDLHPMVWYPHEPLRSIHDLRHDQPVAATVDGETMLHVYPKQVYDSVGSAAGTTLDLEATLRTLTMLDSIGRPDCVVANSEYMASYLREVYHLPEVNVVYPGVAIEKTMELPHGGDIVLAIGQLWRHKRTRLIIEAISQVENVQLYVVGMGPELQHLKILADRMGVADRVFFLHGLDNHEVQILLARCLCVVFTPLREPFGIVALEALAAGKPLVAVNEGGYCEIVDENCAFLVPPLPVEIAARIRQLQADRPLAKRMGAHGREVARNFTWDKTSAELLAIIENAHAAWVAALQAPVDVAIAEPPLIGIHYFNWYSEGFGNQHWSDNLTYGGVSDSSQLGYYASLSGETIAYHLDLMEEMKLDFVIFNLHADESGIDKDQLNAAEIMMQMAKKRGSSLRFAVTLCLYTSEASSIEAAMTALRDLLTQANYQRLRGKPLFFILWTGFLDGNYPVIRLLKTLSNDYLRVAASFRLFDPRTEAQQSFDLFDGASLFSPLELSAPEDWEKTWQRAYDDASRMPARLKVVTLSPGYDDTHLRDPNRQGNPYRNVPRDDGAAYRRCMEFAVQQVEPAEMIIISTFNEFHENTHIEPSLRWGRAYVEMTRDFAVAARALRKAKP